MSELYLENEVDCDIRYEECGDDISNQKEEKIDMDVVEDLEANICDLDENDTEILDVTIDSLEDIDREDLSQEDKDGIIRDLLDQNVTEQRLLSDLRAEWSDAEARGNSDCILKDDAEFIVEYKSSGDKVTYSGEEFKEYMREKYGQDYVSYLHKEPDFEPFEQIFDREELEDFLSTKYGRDIHIDRIPEGHIEVERMGTNRNDTYGAAYDYCIDVLGKEVSRTDLAEFMKKKDLTWHECGDRRTIRLVPSEINQIFAHTGGIGIEKDFEALQTELKDIVTNETENIEGISLQKIASYGETDGLSEAIEYRHAENKKRKRELF